MQGLSTRAHAFSVESLVKSCEKITNETQQCMSDSDKDTPSVIDEQDKQNDGNIKITETRRKLIRAKRKSAREVRVDLQGSDLWRTFHEIGTEMIITKTGRRMFPSIRVKVHNLDPFQQYYIAMDIMPVDSKRYRYVYHSSQWIVAGNTDHSLIATRLYIHPDSPCSGEKWMQQVISFDRIKLTNNERNESGHIILQSMNKYKPRIHITMHSPHIDLSQIHPSLPAEGVHTFTFPETQFTTVTAYQNQQITKLKIERNPFAKGFRDSTRNRGLLDGILHSYPWHSPFNLDFKPFAVELQGSCESSASLCITSTLKAFLPNPCSTAANPITSGPKCFPSRNVLTYRAYCNPGLDRLSGYMGLHPLLDLPCKSMMQVNPARFFEDRSSRASFPTYLHQLHLWRLSSSE
ncbi:T-box transcription factor TBX22 [Triplophysa dalaica]|uniref:T-box transcription factor TBX22 n=1 Tax=Triplophysa dalaica TaxID=1582913 RepID=UPI0024DFF712|nr:T-box transcription factor TBX22 [Triplophysa dalaica]